MNPMPKDYRCDSDCHSKQCFHLIEWSPFQHCHKSLHQGGHYQLAMHFPTWCRMACCTKALSRILIAKSWQLLSTKRKLKINVSLPVFLHNSNGATKTYFYSFNV